VAALILLVWVALQLWPEEEQPTPTAQPAAQPSAKATPTPAPITPTPTPPAQPTTTVTLAGGGKTCDPELIRMAASVADGQLAQQPVEVDLSISTSAKAPCVFKPKTYDPLAVVSRGDKRVWDSSACDAPVAAGSVQLTPGWSTVVQVPWMPRRSGKACAATEPWLAAGSYTLEIGTLGGEPGKATFTLAAPPPPPPVATTAPPAVPTPPPATAEPRKKKKRA
jgi:hypothetical protein